MSKCPLHLANNLKDLREEHLVRSNYGRKLDMLCRISDTLYEKAISYSRQQPVDEELLYIFCCRYVNLVTTIKHHLNDDKFHKTRFGTPLLTIEKIKVECEESLSERYKKNEVPIKTDEDNNKMVENIGDMPIDNKPPCIQLIKDDDMFLDLDILYKLISGVDVKLMIIDARPSGEFIECSLKYKNLLNIPDEVIGKGLSTNTLQQKLLPDTAALFKQRHTFDFIVLLDTDTTKISYPSSKLEDLRSILINWDIEQKYPLLPLVLDGGIRGFVDKYPSLVTNASKIYNKFFVGLDDLMSDIEYPEIPSFDKPPVVHVQEVPVSPEKVVEVKPTLEEEINRDQTSKRDAEAIKFLKKIITLAKQQLENEGELLALIHKRFEIRQMMFASNRQVSLNDMKDLESKVVKAESYKLELDLRRNMFDAKYTELKMHTHDRILNEFLREIYDCDKLRAAKARKRAEVEASEQAFQAKQSEHQKSKISEEITWKKIIPKAPDRMTKPGELVLIQQLSDKYRNTGLTGLINIRNTCYLNSLIQCLRFCPILLHFITKSSFKESNPDTSFTYYFAELIKKMWSENKVALRPSNFYSEVCRKDNYEKGYANGRHEDVQEFFIFLTRLLHTEMAEPMEADNRECTAKLKDWVKNFENKTSFISRAFFYQIEIRSTCLSCHKCVIKYEYGNTVFVNLPQHGRAINIQDKLKEYMQVSQDDQNASKFCTKCELKMDCAKRVSYYPPILAVNIVRYDFSRIEKCILRRDNDCIFQREVSFGSQKYSLKSVSLHSGNRDVGHYTALCFNPFDKRCIEFNDEYCNYVNENDPIYKTKCYMLFYTLIQNPDNVNKNFFQN